MTNATFVLLSSGKRPAVHTAILAPQIWLSRIKTHSEVLVMAGLIPTFVVDQIDLCAAFWVDRLGFEKRVDPEQPAGADSVALVRGELELMYQSKSALGGDLSALAGCGERSIVCMEIENLEELESRMSGLTPIIPIRETSYGSAEVGYADPVGNVIIFRMRAGY